MHAPSSRTLADLLFEQAARYGESLAAVIAVSAWFPTPNWHFALAGSPQACASAACVAETGSAC